MTIEELRYRRGRSLFGRMVQTGAIVAAQNNWQTAMNAVEVAGATTLSDIPDEVSPAAAAYQLVEHYCLRGPRLGWLRL